MAGTLKQPGLESLFNNAETEALRNFWKRLFELLSLSSASKKLNEPITPASDEIESIISSHGSKKFAEALWNVTMLDNPDFTAIKFIRARKLNIGDAIRMFVECLKWRIETDVDAIVARGDIGFMALGGQDGEAFKRQVSGGQTYIQGFDKKGGPVAYVFARYYRAGDQSPKASEDFIVYAIEIVRMFTAHPKSKTTVIVDLTGFSMLNMDWKTMLFFNKCLEAYYPESLQTFIIHNAPWVFQGIWRVVSPTLDPVVRSKIVMTKSNQDVLAHVNERYLITELGGSTTWRWRYTAPKDSPDLSEARKTELLSQRKNLIKRYVEATNHWLKDSSATHADVREYVATMMRVNYISLDPYIKGRTFYHEEGNVCADGRIGFYTKPDRSDWEYSPYASSRQELLDKIDKMKASFESSNIKYPKLDFDL
ncbi:hypothetical protein CROQUDRAFT_656116 [Cronartium quercuum f. sp. fusiforme G11]|uniref:CRAL-TRIO domain-containing protein n=1 Tax=Cronartium quercuum f. sp. fusiforme G11 TaxID=708437 RepID=A0A9P6TD29_9BASI|nr:hypothetical protein CROQUDRAFT_656116 [Cronartium quercuum f. sp. fusiforme G11]